MKPATQITAVYPDTIIEYQKQLLEQISIVQQRIIEDFKRRHCNTIPTTREVRAVHEQIITATKAYHDELVRIESLSVRHYIVAQ